MPDEIRHLRSHDLVEAARGFISPATVYRAFRRMKRQRVSPGIYIAEVSEVRAQLGDFLTDRAVEVARARLATA